MLTTTTAVTKSQITQRLVVNMCETLWMLPLAVFGMHVIERQWKSLMMDRRHRRLHHHYCLTQIPQGMRL